MNEVQMRKLQLGRFLTSGKIYLWLVRFLISIVVVPCSAQFPQLLNNSDITIVKSPLNNNVTIAFKSPIKGTCTTAFTTQKQFTGYISLPPDVLGSQQSNYTSNIFFWFIEARQIPESAPLTLFVNGGPGSSSMVGMFQEVGPCEVVEVARGRLGTVPREWGWDRSSNILFVDQPTQVGFSFDSLTNASVNLLTGQIIIPPTNFTFTQSPYTFLNGTISSGNPASTANTSQIAAQFVWHFLQSFLATFPEYNPRTRNLVASVNSKTGINLFTESYGGKYAPAIAKFFRQQNQLRQSDVELANSTLEIEINSLGIINGWIDLLVQAPSYPRFAYNNTYGIKAVSQLQQLNALSAFSAADGCRAKTISCRAQEAGFDPLDRGRIEIVNDMCSEASASCQTDVIAPYLTSGRSVYDISQGVLDPFPSLLYLEYLNSIDVQQAIGTSVNFTQSSGVVGVAFNETGDYARGGILDDLIETLNAGTRVSLIYGDRDYICNWFGGEAVSFALAAGAGPAYERWYGTGYAPIVVNSTYVGGVVREYGNLSFSRIYDAGHLVPAYQPETAFTVFSRIIQGTGISMGNQVDLSNFSSAGDLNSTHKNTAPATNDPECFIRAVNMTCNVDQKNMLANNAGVVINGILYNAASEWKPPPYSIVSLAGSPGTVPSDVLTSNAMTQMASSSVTGVPTTSRTLTGVYTATSIPSITSTPTANMARPILLRRSNKILGVGILWAVPFAFGFLTFNFV